MGKEAVLKPCGKGENAGNQHFLFPQCFFYHIKSTGKCIIFTSELLSVFNFNKSTFISHGLENKILKFTKLKVLFCRPLKKFSSNDVF